MSLVYTIKLCLHTHRSTDTMVCGVKEAHIMPCSASPRLITGESPAHKTRRATGAQEQAETSNKVTEDRITEFLTEQSQESFSLVGPT